MTYRACSVDVYQADEEAEDDREEWDCTNYENWIVDHYSELADSYQQVSDQEEALQRDLLVRNYEFQARGGFLPKDTVMAEVEPGCWSRSVVLLVGVAMLVVVVERSDFIQAVTKMNSLWMD